MKEYKCTSSKDYINLFKDYFVILEKNSQYLFPARPFPSEKDTDALSMVILSSDIVKGSDKLSDKLNFIQFNSKNDITQTLYIYIGEYESFSFDINDFKVYLFKKNETEFNELLDFLKEHDILYFPKTSKEIDSLLFESLYSNICGAHYSEEYIINFQEYIGYRLNDEVLIETARKERDWQYGEYGLNDRYKAILSRKFEPNISLDSIILISEMEDFHFI